MESSFVSRWARLIGVRRIPPPLLETVHAEWFAITVMKVPLRSEHAENTTSKRGTHLASLLPHLSMLMTEVGITMVVHMTSSRLDASCVAVPSRSQISFTKSQWHICYNVHSTVLSQATITHRTLEIFNTLVVAPKTTGIPFCPLPANSLCILPVIPIMFCDINGKRVIRIGGAEEALYGYQNSANGQGRRPSICDYQYYDVVVSVSSTPFLRHWHKTDLSVCLDKFYLVYLGIITWVDANHAILRNHLAQDSPILGWYIFVKKRAFGGWKG
jgi:hypothetical protein